MSGEDLSDLIGLIYEASIEPLLWPDVLEQVTNVTPCVVATLYSYDLIGRMDAFHQSFGLNAEYMQQYQAKWASANPLIDAVAMIEPGQVSGLDPIIDYDAFTRHPFYLEWGKPQNFCDAINIMLERTPTRFSSVSLITNDEQGLATPDMLARLRILAPHFLRAIRIGRVLDHASIREETMTATLDTLASAVFVLSRKGDLVHANKSASDLVRQGLTIGRIKAASKFLEVPAHRGTTEDVEATPGDHVRVLEVESGERFVCHYLPLPLHKGVRDRSARLTLVVVQNTTSTDKAARTIATLFGLTNREREILFGLVEVGGITAVAEVLGLSKGTVKTHVKSLFSKTRTHRQSDLVKLVGGLMPPFHEPS